MEYVHDLRDDVAKICERKIVVACNPWITFFLVWHLFIFKFDHVSLENKINLAGKSKEEPCTPYPFIIFISRIKFFY